MEYQICKKCVENKPLTIEFFPRGQNIRSGISIPYWYRTCKICSNKKSNIKNRKYKEKNRVKIAAAQRAYHKNNKENDSLTKKKWYQINKDSVLLRVKTSIYARRENDASFRLKENISCNIRASIKKDRKSIVKFLPYSIEELKVHLENLFESWMTWKNYGTYRVDIWDDNDPATWAWQLDHIIPHSRFNYTSMEDQIFKDCWALSNLRPYSAKQNIIDGNRK
jgi:hypothetical protein